MKIRGVQFDHATIQRWVYKFTPFIVAQMKKRKLRVGSSGRMDESYIKVMDSGVICIGRFIN